MAHQCSTHEWIATIAYWRFLTWLIRSYITHQVCHPKSTGPRDHGSMGPATCRRGADTSNTLFCCVAASHSSRESTRGTSDTAEYLTCTDCVGLKQRLPTLKNRWPCGVWKLVSSLLCSTVQRRNCASLPAWKPFSMGSDKKRKYLEYNANKSTELVSATVVVGRAQNTIKNWKLNKGL